MELSIQATATLPRQEIFLRHVSSASIHTSRAFPPPSTALLLVGKNEAFASKTTLRPQCSSSEMIQLVDKENYSKTMDDADFESAADSQTSLTNESSMPSSISLDARSTEKPEVSATSKHKTGYVAVLGHPNVGKSTLSNQMVGQKLSIVTEKPQTTRHRILGICSGPDYQIILYDTPGIIKKKMHKLDSMMMTSVRGAASNANCAMVVVDASKIPQKIDHVLEGAGDTKCKLPTLVVLNKKDLVKPHDIVSQLNWYEQFADVVDEVIPISAKYADGVEDVMDWILSKLPYGPALYPKDIASQHPERFFIAEIIREKIFMLYRNEIPYSSQVNIVDYKSRPMAKDFIKAEIVVEKKSQSAILIGSGGNALKQVTSAAQIDIEKFIDKQVYLVVSVGVEKKWRQNVGYLKSYGYAWHMPPH